MLLLVGTLCNAVLIAFSHECGIAPAIYKDFDFLDVSNGPSGRILNGQRVAENALPFVASLGFKIGPKTDLGCTASIIAPQYVLTAAHCFFQTKLSLKMFLKVTSIHYGSKYFRKSKSVRIVEIFHTSDSTPESYEDILVVKLAEPIEFDYKTVAPVCLSFGAKPDTFGNVLVAGFGNHSFTEQKFGKPDEYLVEVLPVKKGRYCK
uniref:Peptidase S1 domain-containing protein n=1 Tax=Panagrellus redivivus TaxID=6233 RepID=A0A7E4USS2_PANRE